MIDVLPDVGDDNAVQTALAELKALIAWINDNYSRIALPGDRRSQLANGCLDVALEHQMAIELLGRAGLYGSMLALVRALLEAFTRGSWLARCATDAEIQYLLDHDDIRKTFEVLTIEVERAIGNELSTLLNLKKRSWGTMNSFTHTGMEQITRRHGPGTTGPNYSSDDIVKGATLSGVIGLLAAIEMATIAGNVELAKATLERSREFAAR